MADLRTPEQKKMMERMGPLIWSMMGKGATPFGGQLSAPPDPSMLSAMNVMSQVGGQGPYTFPGMQTGPYPPPQGMDLPPWNFSPTRNGTTGTEDTGEKGKQGGRRGKGPGGPERGPGNWGDERRRRRDPYAPW